MKFLGRLTPSVQIFVVKLSKPLFWDFVLQDSEIFVIPRGKKLSFNITTIRLTLQYKAEEDQIFFRKSPFNFSFILQLQIEIFIEIIE